MTAVSPEVKGVLNCAFRGLVGALLCVLLAAQTSADQKRVLRLVQWSDIHAGGSHFSGEAWDTAFSQGLTLSPDALILTGDQGDSPLVAQDYDRRVRPFLASLGRSLRGERVPFLFCLGNNDFRMNYQTDPTYLAETDTLYRATLGDRYYLDPLGNGEAPVRVGGMVWLTLNSQLFSPINRYAGSPQQASQALDWLERRLGQLGGAPVVLLMHIPPTWDLWTREPAWRLGDMRRLDQLMGKYPGPMCIVAGHYHRNQVQAYHRPQGDVPVLVTGSLSTKYEYQPCWRSYEWTLGPRGGLTHVRYSVRYPRHPDWTADYDLDNPGEFLHNLLENQARYARYVTDVYCHHPKVREWSIDPGIRQAIMDEYWVRCEATVPR